MMNHRIKNISNLKIILWLDALLGGVTAIIGLTFFNKLSPILGLTTPLILTISIITFFYAVVALILATQPAINIPLLRSLVSANWIWTFISIVLLFIYHNSVTIFGLTFLIVQVLVVGGLAYLETGQVKPNNKKHH
jgi:hypothetical protein